MARNAMGFRRVLSILAAVTLATLSVPVGNALALSATDPTPLPPSTTVPELRLELAWARLQASHARMNVMFGFANQRTAEVQNLIDQAKAGGKDVAALQTALDNLESAVKQAQPIFDGTTATIAAHPGFDSGGNVTDLVTANDTVKGLAEKDREIGSILSPAGQAFQQALQSFRQSGGVGSGASAANLRLELAWARLQAGHARMEVIFDFADQRTAEVQQLIDQASARGKDVAGLQTALDNLEAALKQAHPIFEGTTGAFASHQGFDPQGSVTDATEALQTVRDMAAKNQQIEAILGPAQEAFQQALQAFRQTNAPTATPVP